jgi:ABC-type transport system involved in multi-copper enzyme maturation permease subunit
MSDALRYEWMRIRTIRSTWWLTGVAAFMGLVFTTLVSWGISTSLANGDPTGPGEMDVVASAVTGQFSGDGLPFFVAYVLAMIGVFAWGHEYRHGMIRATLTALSSRRSAWTAKFVVLGVWVAVSTFLTLVLSAVVGWLWLRDDGVDFTTSAVTGTVLKSVVYAVLLTWLAAAATSVMRQQTAALVLLFLWPLAIENIITGVLMAVPAFRDVADWARFLPFNAGARMLGIRDVTGSMFGDPLSPWAGFVVFGGTTAVVMAAGLALFTKRDA